LEGRLPEKERTELINKVPFPREEFQKLELGFIQFKKLALLSK
jgi:hypothetical protein